MKINKKKHFTNIFMMYQYILYFKKELKIGIVIISFESIYTI